MTFFLERIIIKLIFAAWENKICVQRYFREVAEIPFGILLEGNCGDLAALSRFSGRLFGNALWC